MLTSNLSFKDIFFPSNIEKTMPKGIWRDTECALSFLMSMNKYQCNVLKARFPKPLAREIAKNLELAIAPESPIKDCLESIKNEIQSTCSIF